VQGNSWVVTKQVAAERGLAHAQGPDVQVVDFLYALELGGAYAAQVVFDAWEVEFVRDTFH